MVFFTAWPRAQVIFDGLAEESGVAPFSFAVKEWGFHDLVGWLGWAGLGWVCWLRPNQTAVFAVFWSLDFLNVCDLGVHWWVVGNTFSGLMTSSFEQATAAV